MALSGDARTARQVEPELYPRAARAAALRLPLPVRQPRAPRRVRPPRRSVSRRRSTSTVRGEVAAVLMEPNAGTNGIVAPDGVLAGAARGDARGAACYLIADEVMSGFGRCGEWFAWQRYGEAGRPDLMTLAKGLTGAHLPLGAVVLSADGGARASSTQMLTTGLTYCGHPLSCAAGIAALESLRARSGSSSARGGSARAMLAQLERLQARHAVIGDVRGGHGLFAVVELVTRPREPRAARAVAGDASRAERARRACPRRGRVLRGARQSAAARPTAGDHRATSSPTRSPSSTGCSASSRVAVECAS